MQTKRYPARALQCDPQDLVEGWPRDYLGNYVHPQRNAQLLAAQVEPFRRLDEWVAGKALELPGFILYGPAGFGKTSVALACLLRLARQGFHTRFITAERIAAERESTVFNHREGKTVLALLEELLAPEALVIDDVATREYTGNVRAILFDAIRERHSRRGLTILTTNIKLGPNDDSPDEQKKAGQGRAQFAAALDARVLSTYTGQGFNAFKWGAEDRPAASLRGARP